MALDTVKKYSIPTVEHDGVLYLHLQAVGNIPVPDGFSVFMHASNDVVRDGCVIVSVFKNPEDLKSNSHVTKNDVEKQGEQ